MVGEAAEDYYRNLLLVGALSGDICGLRTPAKGTGLVGWCGRCCSVCVFLRFKSDTSAHVYIQRSQCPCQCPLGHQLQWSDLFATLSPL